MRKQTRRRHLGVVLAILAVAGLAVACTPEPSSGTPTNPCPTVPTGPVANLGGGKCPPACPTTSTGTPVANLGGGSCPTTPTVPSQPCDASTLSGGAGVTTTTHDLGTAGPTSFLFQFNAQSVPDRFEVLYQGVQIYDTGWRGSPGYTDSNGDPITVVGPGAGSATVTVPAGASTVVTVVVTGSSSGTAWDYVVNCPAPVT